MKRIYSAPQAYSLYMESEQALLIASQVYTDNPQLPGSALSRRRGHHGSNDWYDDLDEDDEEFGQW